MRPQRQLIAVLRSTTPEQRYESLSWFVYNLFGSTLPIWLGGYILLPIFSKHFNWIEYTQHGELALYSAAFLAPTLRLIGKDVEDSVFVRRQSFLFLGGILAAEMPPNTIHVDTRLLFGFSIFLFAVSVILSSLVRLIDYQRIQPKQVFALQHASETRLDDEFEKTSPQSKGPSSNETLEVINQQPLPSESEGAATTSAHVDDRPDSDSNANEGPDDGTREN